MVCAYWPSRCPELLNGELKLGGQTDTASLFSAVFSERNVILLFHWFSL